MCDAATVELAAQLLEQGRCVAALKLLRRQPDEASTTDPVDEAPIAGGREQPEHSKDAPSPSNAASETDGAAAPDSGPPGAGAGATEMGSLLGRAERLVLGVQHVMGDIEQVQRSEAGWRVARDSDGLRVALRIHGNTGAISMCFQAQYPVPPSWLLSFAREFDAQEVWNKYVLQAAVTAVPSLLSAYLFGVLWLPWPFSNRSAVMKAEGL